MDIDRDPEDSEWQQFCDHNLAALPQRSLYAQACAAVGRPMTRLALREAGDIVAGAQFLTRTLLGVPVWLTSRGPLSGNAPLSQTCAALSCATPRLTLMTPQDAGGAPRRRLSLAGPQVATLDLRGGPEAIRARMHQKWRNRLVKSETARVTPARLNATPESLAPLLRAEKAQQKARNYRALPAEFTLALHHADARALWLYEAAGGQMLFLKHGNTATYWIGHAPDAARRANAHNAILWRAACDLAAAGVVQIDLGRVDPRAAGLLRFKRESGARLQSLGRSRLL
ncbi:GNAT family N-acetyltransferase [Aquimixticola soesokkakensis]|nr:GNAT family N-acetyltransferase [Aquimixticola soesokkakensis]